MSVFAVITAKGPEWDDARGIREQAFFPEHASFMDELTARGVIILGGPVDSDDPGVIALLAVDAPDEAAARAVFDADPWTKHQVFGLKEVRAWTIWLDARRSGLRHPLPPGAPGSASRTISSGCRACRPVPCPIC